MAYQVIARKWRPQSFDQLVGQDHIAQTLINALKSSRLPHALLFTGPRGTGKTSSARILAKSLRCPNAVDFVPCNTCSECNDIGAGRSLDVIEIDGASNNGVDAIRELRETVGYMPSSGKNKVYIVDEVHMLSTSAFNALLKTLEEPPSHVTFVLATTEIQKIPNTILSRCQRFDFRTISTRNIVDRLKEICDADGVNVEVDALWAVARQAGGSMRDSQSLLDQVITFCSGEVTLDAVIRVLGLTDRTLLINTLHALVERNEQAAIETAQSIFQSGSDPKVFIQDLLEEIRNLLFVKIGKESAQLVDLPESELNELTELSEKLGDHDIHLLFDMTLKGSTDIHRSQDPRIVLEMLLLRMVSAPRIVGIQQIQGGFSSSGSGGGSTKAAASPQRRTQASQVSAQMQQPKAEQPAEKEAMAQTAPQTHIESGDAITSGPMDIWTDFVEKVKATNGLLGALLENTHLVEKTESEIKLGVSQKMGFLSDKLKEEANVSRVKTFLKTFWNQDLNVVFELSTDDSQKKTLTPKESKEEVILKKKMTDKEQIEGHPLVQSTQKQFKSEIVSIKEKP